MNTIITDRKPDSLDPTIEVLAQIRASIVQYGCDSEEKLIMAADPDVEALMIFLAVTPVTRRVMEAFPSCKIIARGGIGVDQVDLDAATELGIPVTNVPDYCVDEVSSHTLALLLACARKVCYLHKQVQGGSYDALAGYPIYRLAGSTVGLVGLGRMGRAVARKLQGFDLRLLVNDPFVPGDTIRGYGAVPTDLESLLENSDYVCLLLPVTPDTYHLIGKEELARMKATAYVINAARGALIDQEALTEALKRGTIAGAGLDVLEEEPPVPDDPLLELTNVVLTPHTAWYSEQALRDSRRTAAQEVARVLTGQRPRYLVNEEVYEGKR
jgi:D-3-phosphoglycerate dehydrogenase